MCSSDLVLLLAVLHPGERLARLVAQARDLGLEPLVEAHDERELDDCLASGATLVGINNRDLKTMTTDLGHVLRLRDRVPEECTLVAESGIRSRAEVRRLEAAGIGAMLVGESLLKRPDPGAAAAALLADD